MDRKELRRAIDASATLTIVLSLGRYARRQSLNESTVMPHYLELVWYKGCADLRAEAARYYLGVLWWVLEPLLYMTAFYVVFGLLLHRGGPGFVSFLLCGLVIWRWFAASVQRSSGAIASNSGLMLQVYLPKYLFPASVLVTNGIKFAFVFALLLFYLILSGLPVSAAWMALPMLFLAQLLWTGACGLVVAAIVPFAPDLKFVIGNAITLMFFMSGVFYDIGELPPQFQFYFQLNPMATLIESYRDVLLHGAWPDWGALSIALAMSLILAMAGMRLLLRFDRVYPKLVVS